MFKKDLRLYCFLIDSIDLMLLLFNYNISLYPFYKTACHNVYFIRVLVLRILFLVAFVIREVHSCC